MRADSGTESELQSPCRAFREDDTHRVSDQFVIFGERHLRHLVSGHCGVGGGANWWGFCETGCVGRLVALDAVTRLLNARARPHGWAVIVNTMRWNRLSALTKEVRTGWCLQCTQKDRSYWDRVRSLTRLFPRAAAMTAS
jgi:hypothetical protein